MPQNIFNDAKERMELCVMKLDEQFALVRTGRANPAILDSITAEAYGVETPIPHLATVSIPEARQILIKPFDKNNTATIERAIISADLGINPNSDGESIRLIFPPLTEETRRIIVKDVKKIMEDSKVQIRNIRRDANDHIKKLDISEDDIKGWQEDIQEITDEHIKMIEEATKEKEKDVMTV
jgi:ribosome recycling factor